MLWSGLTHCVLGAPVNSTGYIKSVHCPVKQSTKKSPTKGCKVHLNMYIHRQCTIAI